MYQFRFAFQLSQPVVYVLRLSVHCHKFQLVLTLSLFLYIQLLSPRRLRTGAYGHLVTVTVRENL
jgi:hypothetical protein